MQAQSTLAGYAAHNRRVNDRWKLAPHQPAACVRLPPVSQAAVKQLQQYLDAHWDADGLKIFDITKEDKLKKLLNPGLCDAKL